MERKPFPRDCDQCGDKESVRGLGIKIAGNFLIEQGFCVKCQTYVKYTLDRTTREYLDDKYSKFR